MKKSDPPIIVEQSFNKTVAEVWDAITDIEQMRQWYFENIPAFKAEVGFETQFNVKSADRDFLHIWKVSEVLFLQKITYNWKYKEYAGEADVTFELSAEDGVTKLRLIQHILEDFPADIPEFRRESCIAGWTYFINKSLKEFLDK